jgi:hypothetical protein
MPIVHLINSKSYWKSSPVDLEVHQISPFIYSFSDLAFLLELFAIRTASLHYLALIYIDFVVLQASTHPFVRGIIYFTAPCLTNYTQKFN